MENQLFRKKSLDRISSPEALHDYMRVTSPRLWMMLAAILVLLIGFIVYASTAKLENIMPISITAEDGVVSARLPMSEMETVRTGMKVRIGEEEGTVGWISVVDDEINLVIRMDREDIRVPDGEHEGKLVVESTTPVSFLWN